MAFVKKNFEVVILAIIFISVIPLAVEAIRGYLEKKKSAAVPTT
jgi:hypothetical protein